MKEHSKPEDSRIIADIQEGGTSRESALEQLFKSDIFQKKIPGVLLKLNLRKVDVEDIICEALIAVDKNIRKGTFKGKSSLSTYCVQIAKFMAYNRFKENKKTISTDEDWLLDSNIDPDATIPEEEDANKAMKKLLLKQCTDHEREALRLYSLNYKMKEIGQQLGIKENSAKMLIYRAIKKLRHFIKENPDKF